MSIAAAENAGLGPCELPLPDHWLVHTQLSQSSSQQYSTPSPAIGGPSLGLGGLPPALPQQQSSSHSTSPLQQTPSASQQQQLQPKIMNAVVPAVSVPAANKKIRRKPDTKPQSQINKCNNEKRRRELENEYIEQLGEFLQINKRDMTACKPDKAAILSEVVKTFRRLLEQGNRDLTGSNRCSKCSPDCSDSCKLHPVQQGEVSSTEPPLPEPSVNGHSPEKSAYFEAVKYYISNVGWVLLEINSEGVIECATDNVLDVLHYTRTELHGQSIYSYLHTGDHSKLSPILNKNSFELNWDQNEFLQPPKRTIRTKIRWLLKTPESANDTIEQKQQRQEKYKDLLIISAPVKDDTDAESSSVLCLITLPEDEHHQGPAIESHTMPQTLDEQLTLKLDMTGAVIDFDAATLRKQFTDYLTKETVRSIHDLCHFQDRPRLNEHLQNVMNANGAAQVSSYRLRLGGPDVYVHVKAQTRLFRNNKPNEPDFIMAIHTILNDNEVAMVESGLNNPSSSSSSSLAIPSTSSGSGSSTARQMQQITQGVSNMGGPLMSSILNGSGNSGGPGGPSGLQGALGSVVSPRSSNLHSSLLSQQSSDGSSFFPSEFEFEFPHSTYDMESVGVNWDSRPDSRTSVTPVSTPRPPSVTAYSPAAASLCPSPLTYQPSSAGGQPSPSNNQQVNNNNNNSSMTNNNAGLFGGFQCQFDDKDKVQEQIQQQQQQLQQQQQQQQHQQQMASHDSERLRNLLTTKRPHSNASSSSGMDMDHDHRNPNRILKGLLNSEEDKDSNGNKLSTTTLSQRLPQSVRAHQSQGGAVGGGGVGGGVVSAGLGGARPSTEHKSGSNNMLLQLLNDKSDDDDADARNRPSELLRQLQKVKDEPKPHQAPLKDEELLQMLQVQRNDRKRSSTEPDEGAAAKRSDDKPSKLREKNKMLASLLANPAKAPTQMLAGHSSLRIIPDIPTSNISRQMGSVTSSTAPNQTLNNNNLTTSNNNLKHVQHLRMQQQQQMRKSAMPSPSQQPPTSSDIYLSHQQQQQALLQQQLIAAQQRQQNYAAAIQDSGIGSVGSGPFATPSTATSTTSHATPEWDPELNEILNHVIDIAPDVSFADSELTSFLGSMDPSTSTAPSQASQQDIQEKLAINAIQKSLMREIENVTSPMQYSGSPPAYPMHGMGSVGSPAGQMSQQTPGTPTTPNPNFTPPPVYQPRLRMSGPGGPGVGQLGNGAPSPSAIAMQKLSHQQQQRERMQEQQRQRLLQQQKQQQMVVPVNATANADLNLGLTPGMQNIESLLNNTVAPNVSLTRANSVVPDSQLSPGFSPSQLMQQQLSPNQRTQLSPQQTAGFQGNPFNNNPGHRMSPQQQQQLVAAAGFQQGNPGNQQLSPRQPPFNTSQQLPQANAAALQQQQQQQWQQNARLSIQQQNPMLNAQLSTVPGFNPAAAANRQFVAPQRQRSLNSPGTPRQGSFGSTVDGSGFPGPPSPSQPNAGAGPNFGNPVFANQQMRLQRQGSVPPQATQHLPGSPRPSYGGHGPGPDTSGYGMMFNNATMQQQHSAGSPGDYFNRSQAGGNNGGGLGTSEHVRQELRAVVSGRAQNAASGGVGGAGGLRTPQSPIGMSPMGGVGVGGSGAGAGTGPGGGGSGAGSGGGVMTGMGGANNVGSTNSAGMGPGSNGSVLSPGMGGITGNLVGSGGGVGGSGTGSVGGGGGGGVNSSGNGDGMQTSQLPEFFGGNTSR
ncbi:nuclear receptor coactivator 2 isoform X3 [Aedes aegypti]|uniref:Uncharacterized protein n=1 Tax=Aedes aegypti TaxID=7159 RepID=A0A6I8U6Q9_AEDAE|nr:nuclear receptor coactivator 2 isoform X3 [Aedes aegypti]